MINFFRIFLAAFATTLVAAAMALFFHTEQRSKILDDSKAQWAKADIEHPNKDSEQYRSERLKFEQFREYEEGKLQFQCYLFLRDLDEEYVPDLQTGGLASLGLAGILLMLLVLSIVYLLGNQKKNIEVKIDKPVRRPEFAKTASIKTAATKEDWAEPARAMPKTEQTATFTAAAPKPSTGVNVNDLLRKAVECDEKEYMQAITYLEQAIDGSLQSKLPLSALLLCGSLRLKHKVGKDKGKEQLEKIISASPQSSEAQKAQTVLDTFK
ncbi:MAG: hypothetical protein FWC26_07700 [Fibromonadales bacterium]|nr:hypothetical protein [Fibromonadales bacterium]